jgi:ankyrin repeat protein
MAAAAEGGQREVVEFMIELGADDYNKAMVLAAWGGHKEIVKMMLELGAKNYNRSMASAARSEHDDIAELIRNYKNEKERQEGASSSVTNTNTKGHPYYSDY